MVDLAEGPPVISAERLGDLELTPARLKVAAVCMIGVALATTVLPFCAVGAALGPMMLELGWGANQLSLSYALMLWAAALSVWPVGILIDRYGARPVVALGAVAIALVSLMLPLVRHFWQFCALFSLLGVCGAVGLGYSKIIATLFGRRLGLALGVFAAEGSALSMILPLATNRLVQESGWRGAFAILGVLVLAIAPLLYFGLATRRGEAEPPRATDPGAEGMNASQAVKTRAFWLIVLATLVSGVVGNIVLAGVGAALVHRGLGDAAAGLRGTPIGLLATLAGPICAGLVLDRTRSPVVAVAAYLLSALTCVVWAVVSPGFGGKPLLMAGFVLGAFAFSAQSPMVGYLFSRYFGLKSFATACSLQSFIQAMVIGVAGTFIAQSMGALGQEPVVFAIGTAAPLAAAALYLLLPAYRFGAPPEPGLVGQSPRSFRTWWSRAPS